MKLKGSFDAKRLRPREPRNWGARLAAGLSALLATLGILLAMAGFAGLLGNYAALDEKTRLSLLYRLCGPLRGASPLPQVWRRH